MTAIATLKTRPAKKTIMGHYKKMAIMMLISFVVMYAVMFMNVDSVRHIYLSLTRTYMSLMMVSPMAIIMLALMRNMYSNKNVNGFIYTGSTIVFILCTILLRTQTPVSDIQYMKAMIPHHSSAIMTSKHADIKDPEVKKLAEQIISSQQEEIDQMKKIIERLKNNR